MSSFKCTVSTVDNVNSNPNSASLTTSATAVNKDVLPEQNPVVAEAGLEAVERPSPAKRLKSAASSTPTTPPIPNSNIQNDHEETIHTASISTTIDNPCSTNLLSRHSRKSVFASNRAIHQLTKSILNSKHHNAQAVNGTSIDNSCNTNNENNTPTTTGSEDQSNSTNNYEEDEDVEIQITQSNTTNAIIDYPHPRYLCGKYAFQKDDEYSTTSQCTAHSPRTTKCINPYAINKNNSSSNIGNNDNKYMKDINEHKNDCTNNNSQTCPNCYCYVCDIPSSQCTNWNNPNNARVNGRHNNHCNAHDKDEYWIKLRALAKYLRGDISSGHNGNTNNNARDNNIHDVEVIEIDEDDDDDNNGDNDNDMASTPQIMASSPSQSTSTTTHTPNTPKIIANPYKTNNHNFQNNTATSEKIDEDDFLDAYDNHFASESNNMIGNKSRRDARITEVLSHNLREMDIARHMQRVRQKRNNAKINGDGDEKMQGDIPQLNLHSSFFMEGVRIGWPYPVIMPPQRQMALHLIKAFRNKRHVVIESPTGTGKSAAILCTALAWQRYNSKLVNTSCNQNDDSMTSDLLVTHEATAPKTKIIYCSRTHSQVAQMVQSLKKTPYRPKMAILGSRDRMCIHKDLRPRDVVTGGGRETKWRVPASQINLQCQIRVQNTEKYRKSMYRSQDSHYDDDDPITSLPGDGTGSDGVHEDIGQTEANRVNDNVYYNAGEEEDMSEIMASGKPKKTCPHYRQLSTKRLASNLHSTFVPDSEKVNCCSVGGDKTKLGAHDIEDLVSFGVQPNVKKGVAIYRNKAGDEKSFGMTLAQARMDLGNITIAEIAPGGAAEREGSLNVDDTLMSINGTQVAQRNPLGIVIEKIRQSKDPLMLDVYMGDSDEIDVNEYSSQSACPYYISRALAKNADLIFCPYNYILDPGIRSAMDIEIKDAIIVLDEAHNVEDTLRNLGSDTFREFELIDMMVLLNSYAVKWIPKEQRISYFSAHKQDGEDLREKLPEITHDILVCVEKVLRFLKESKTMFENDRGPTGVTKATAEYEKFKCPDNKEWELKYFGPTGYGTKGKPTGCQGFFATLNFQKENIEFLSSQTALFEQYFSSQRVQDEASQKRNKLADRIVKFINTICTAFRLSEHYYISSIVTANGNLDYATGNNDENESSRYKKKPAPLLGLLESNRRMCPLKSCNTPRRGCVSHDDWCDGSTPKWESSIVINLLTPGVLMNELSKYSHSLVFASGSLAPIPSLCSELNLLPPDKSAVSNMPQAVEKKRNVSDDSSPDMEFDPEQNNAKFIDPFAEKFGRLQVTPKPLEANHVIDLNKQLLSISIGHFPDGSPLSVKTSNYTKAGFHEKLGQAIASLVEKIPQGGVLIFLPSFSFLRKCENIWRNSSTWSRLLNAKGSIVVEPSSASQLKFEEERDRYNENIRTTGKCILIAVFRGKMSEGVSFNDDYARGVICVGVPFPNNHDRTIKAKMNYNDEQGKLCKRELLGGNSWYSQQAYRALAQAIGRCIRHAADYGVIVLLDSRHCDDGSSQLFGSGICEAHAKLPKWMRGNVKTLRPDMQSLGRNEILGGWRGLTSQIKSFFRDARVHSESVLQKQEEDLRKSRQSSGTDVTMSFNRHTGKWSQTL